MMNEDIFYSHKKYDTPYIKCLPYYIKICVCVVLVPYVNVCAYTVYRTGCATFFSRCLFYMCAMGLLLTREMDRYRDELRRDSKVRDKIGARGDQYLVGPE